MLPFIFKRLLNLIPVFIGATLLTFLIIQAAPGDFLDARRLDPRTKPETIARLERRFGLDKPVMVQYGYWLGNMVQGDLGISFDADRPVWELLGPRVGNSALLVFIELFLLYLIAVPVGIYGAVRQYSLGDKVVSVLSYFFYGFPSFFLGLIIIFGILTFQFTFKWVILPITGMTSDTFDLLSWWKQQLDISWHAIAPLTGLLIGDIAGISRSFRGQMLEFLNQDYVRTARAKGLSERVVIYKHTLRNALVPFVAGIGGLLPLVISGAGFIETVFSWPGLTPTFLEALNSQDVYVLLGSAALSLILLVIGNLISDFLLGVVDPRIRFD